MRDDDLIDSYRLGQRDFRDALLPNLRVPHIVLRGIDLSGADLTGAHLVGADLTGANLSRSKLDHADLTDANLEGADLSGASLVGASFVGANLRSALLSGAKTEGATFVGAHLRGAHVRGSPEAPQIHTPAPTARTVESLLEGTLARDHHKYKRVSERVEHPSFLLIHARIPLDKSARNVFAQLVVAHRVGLDAITLYHEENVLLICGDNALLERLAEVFAGRMWRPAEGAPALDPKLQESLLSVFRGDFSALDFLAYLSERIELRDFGAPYTLRKAWLSERPG